MLLVNAMGILFYMGTDMLDLATNYFFQSTGNTNIYSGFPYKAKILHKIKIPIKFFQCEPKLCFSEKKYLV